MSASGEHRRHESWLSCLKKYLQETTLHGLRYLIEGWSKPEKALWLIAILAAFSYALFLGSTSLQDASDNPISSVIMIAELDEVSFPAVTIMEQSDVEDNAIHHRYFATFLNLLKYDCTERWITYPETILVDACRIDSAKLRENMRNLANYMVDRLLATFRGVQGKYKERRWELAKNLDSPNHDITMDYCIMENLLQRELTWEEEDKIKNFLADNLMWHHQMDMFVEGNFYALTLSILNSSGFNDEDHYNAYWDSNCFHDSHTYNFESGLGIMPEVHNLLMHPHFFYDLDEEFTLAEGFELYKRFVSKTYAYITYFNKSYEHDPNLSYLPPRSDGVNPIMSFLPDQNACSTYMQAVGHCFVGEINYDRDRGYAQNIYECACKDMYPENDPWVNDNNGDNVTKEIPSRQYYDTEALFKVLKYATQASTVAIVDDGYLDDMNKLVGAFDYTARPKSAWRHPDPKFLHCTYSSITLGALPMVADRNCMLFNRTFTQQGIGYSFNPSVEFLSKFSNTSYANSFEKIMRTPKQADSSVDVEKKMNKKLDFYIRPNPTHDSSSDVIIIHGPQNFGGKEIELQPGYWYKIIVTPSIVVTDDNVGKIGIKKRGCRFPDELVYEDSIFATYDQTGCFFECMIRSVHDRFGCLPWYYPHFESPVRVCSQPEPEAYHNTMTVFKVDPVRDFVNEEFSYEECGCLPDCNAISYVKEIISKPLEDCEHTVSNLWRYVVAFLEGQIPTDQALSPCSYKPNQLTRVTVEMDTTMMQKVHRMRRVSFSDQVGILGGLLGLFTGMSILSMLEILVWIARWIVSKATSRKSSVGSASPWYYDKSIINWAKYQPRRGYMSKY